jgi:hypothetical protein
MPLIALLLFACSEADNAVVDLSAQRGQTLEVETTTGVFAVHSILCDAETRSTRIVLERDGGRADDRRTVTVAPATLNTEGSLPAGVMYRLSDGHGEPLFEVSVGWDTDTGMSWAHERTRTDDLVIVRRLTDATATETYVINGERLNVTYPNIPWRDVERAVSHYKRLGPAGMRSQPQLVAALAAFEAFYTPHLGNSLHRNPDADLVAAVASSEPIAQAIAVAGGDSPLRPKPRVRDYICAGFGLCAFLKCPFFGPFNTLCDICSAVSVMCVFLPFIVP